MTKKSCSFAGSANGNIPELRVLKPDAVSDRTPEHPSVFGGSESIVPVGTVVELPEAGGFKAVPPPEE